jgi:hypothetical protein
MFLLCFLLARKSWGDRLKRVNGPRELHMGRVRPSHGLVPERTGPLPVPRLVVISEYMLAVIMPRATLTKSG